MKESLAASRHEDVIGSSSQLISWRTSDFYAVCPFVCMCHTYLNLMVALNHRVWFKYMRAFVCYAYVCLCASYTQVCMSSENSKDK